MKLENIGSHDIVDGNQRIILGLIWTIILRFQVRSSKLLVKSLFDCVRNILLQLMTTYPMLNAKRKSSRSSITILKQTYK